MISVNLRRNRPAGVGKRARLRPMRARRFAGIVLAVLTSVSTAGCSNTSLADLLHDDSGDSGSLIGGSLIDRPPSKLSDPEITAAKRDLPDVGQPGVDLCQLLTTPEISAVVRRDPLGPAQGGGIRCEWEFPTSSPDLQDSVSISVAGLDDQGQPTELRGNSALEHREKTSCEEIVALNRPDPHYEPTLTPELAVRVTSLDHDPAHDPADACPQARDLLARAFDRLPPTNKPWG